MPSELRKDILINDHHTVEVDYSGFHVSIAYGLEGLQPPEDPYDLEEPWLTPSDPQAATTGREATRTDRH